jgi:hypothetical protein
MVMDSLFATELTKEKVKEDQAPMDIAQEAVAQTD